MSWGSVSIAVITEFFSYDISIAADKLKRFPIALLDGMFGIDEVYERLGQIQCIDAIVVEI